MRYVDESRTIINLCVSNWKPSWRRTDWRGSTNKPFGVLHLSLPISISLLLLFSLLSLLCKNNTFFSLTFTFSFNCNYFVFVSVSLCFSLCFFFFFFFLGWKWTKWWQPQMRLRESDRSRPWSPPTFLSSPLSSPALSPSFSSSSPPGNADTLSLSLSQFFSVQL